MFEHSHRQTPSHALLADCKIYTFVSFLTCLQHIGTSTQHYATLWLSTSHSIGRRHQLSSSSISNNNSSSRVTFARIAARSTSRGMPCGDTSSTSAAKVLDFSVRIAVFGRNNAPTCTRTSSISTWVSRFMRLISRRRIECLIKFSDAESQSACGASVFCKIVTFLLFNITTLRHSTLN